MGMYLCSTKRYWVVLLGGLRYLTVQYTWKNTDTKYLDKDYL